MPADTFCITGASGFVGRHVVAHLRNSGAGAIRALTRGDPRSAAGVEWITGDLRRRTALDRLLQHGAVALNLAFVADASVEESRAQARELTEACAAAGVRRLVHVSTADVVGATDDPLIDESAPCRPLNAYEQGKLAFESALRGAPDRSFDVVILRPTAVFGRGGRNLVKLARQVAQDSALGNYLRACFHGKRAMNLVAAETVAAAVAFVATREDRVDDAVFFVSEDDFPENNYRAVEDSLRAAFARPPRAIPVIAAPRWAQRAALRAAGRSNTNPDRRFSGARLRELGFRSPVAFADALQEYSAYLAVQWQRDGTVSG